MFINNIFVHNWVRYIFLYKGVRLWRLAVRRTVLFGGAILSKSTIRITLSFLVLALTVVVPSFARKVEKVGVLVLSHGGKEKWNRAVQEAVEPLRQNYLIEIAFGMANPKTMQAAIDKLEAQGVTRIVVVPLFVSSYSPIIRQTEYLLGLRDKLADPPLIMSKDKEKVELKPLKFESEIILTRPLDDHPLVADILCDRILELSRNPSNETVIIVAHGPNDEQDNEKWIETIDSLISQIKDRLSGESVQFKQIFGLTLRDDAEVAIYEKAKEQLRSLVLQSSKEGDVIVVPLLLARGGIEKGVVERLEGLNYKWNGHTLLPHPNITKFIQLSVKKALEDSYGDILVGNESKTLN